MCAGEHFVGGIGRYDDDAVDITKNVIAGMDLDAVDVDRLADLDNIHAPAAVRRRRSDPKHGEAHLPDRPQVSRACRHDDAVDALRDAGGREQLTPESAGRVVVRINDEHIAGRCGIDESHLELVGFLRIGVGLSSARREHAPRDPHGSTKRADRGAEALSAESHRVQHIGKDGRIKGFVTDIGKTGVGFSGDRRPVIRFV